MILASRSPQRAAILRQLGIPFRVEVPGVEEIADGEPRAVVEENARRKCGAVEGDRVLAADTVVVLDGDVLGKPAGREEAERFLSRLAGRDHEVWGGMALRRAGDEQIASAVTRVRFRALERPMLEWYLDSGEWRERAGAYAIQGLGAALVEAVEGDFWNVVGLPVAELARIAPELLTNAGVS